MPRSARCRSPRERSWVPTAILGALGAGGMGEVYRARDPRLSRDVAIKVLPEAFTLHADRLRRFEQEARAAGMLDHPNITAVHDIGEHEGAPYVVTELLEGSTLRAELAGGGPASSGRHRPGPPDRPGPGRRARQGGRPPGSQAREPLRDGRRPGQILGFGLAKLGPAGSAEPNASAAQTEQPATEPGVAMGRVGYMSPEQVRGLGVDHRSDVFAMGAVLYEMLTGQRAFRGETARTR
ncbi:MAG: serine/threonine-protein kinase [Thermoanaerobaculia bacterium]